MTHQGLSSLQALSLLAGRDSRGSVQWRVSVQETRDWGKVRPVQGGLLCSHRCQPRGKDDDDDGDDDGDDDDNDDDDGNDDDDNDDDNDDGNDDGIDEGGPH